ncbi:MAG: hypothetical protein V3V93_05285, partial [bacterium]
MEAFKVIQPEQGRFVDILPRNVLESCKAVCVIIQMSMKISKNFKYALGGFIPVAILNFGSATPNQYRKKKQINGNSRKMRPFYLKHFISVARLSYKMQTTFIVERPLLPNPSSRGKPHLLREN